MYVFLAQPSFSTSFCFFQLCSNYYYFQLIDFQGVDNTYSFSYTCTHILYKTQPSEYNFNLIIPFYLLERFARVLQMNSIQS